jgi:hypothetical protein
MNGRDPRGSLRRPRPWYCPIVHILFPCAESM